MKINFENIESRCKRMSNTPEYKLLIKKVRKARRVFLIGNGGLHLIPL